MLFSPDRHSREVKNYPKLSIRQSIIERINKTNFLGIIIDDQLSWQDHIKHVNLTISQCLGVLYKTRNQLTKTAMITIYYSMIYSHINYCIIIYGKANKKYMESIFKLQKRFLRLATYSAKDAHTAPLFKQFKFLNVYDIYKYNVSQFVYNCIKRPSHFPKTLFTDFFPCKCTNPC